MTVQTVNDPLPEPTETPDPSEDPEETPGPEFEKTVNMLLDNFSYTEENDLNIKGFAFINGLNATADSNIKHEIIMVNYETGEQQSFVANTTSGEIIDYGDGYEYSKIYFDIKKVVKSLN